MTSPAQVVAHRGLQRLFPENTRASVLGALKAGLRYVEIDVQLTKDGVPVVQHDSALKRMSGRAGDIRDLSWARARRLPASEPGRFGSHFARERISTLASLARALARWPQATLFVELKEESLLRFGQDRMLAAVDEALAPARRQCVLISFDEPVLELARKSTRYRLGPVLRNRSRARSAWMRALKPECLFCNARLLPKRGNLKPALGLQPRQKLCIYEVPEVGKARDLIARGADLIETFRADSLQEELRRWR